MIFSFQMGHMLIANKAYVFQVHIYSRMIWTMHLNMGGIWVVFFCKVNNFVLIVELTINAILPTALRYKVFLHTSHSKEWFCSKVMKFVQSIWEMLYCNGMERNSPLVTAYIWDFPNDLGEILDCFNLSQSPISLTSAPHARVGRTKLSKSSKHAFGPSCLEL